MKKFILVFILILSFKKAHAFLGDGGAGWAQVPYLIQIVQENIKRFKQLRDIQSFEKLIHEGVIDLQGIEELIPIDKDILIELKRNHKRIKEIYGDIPESIDQEIHRQNDNAIAESMSLHDSLASYTKALDRNATKLTRQAGVMSPKGAARAVVITNAQILHALNQLIKVNGQLLKIQSGKLALENKNEKEKINNLKEESEGLHAGFKNISSQLVLHKY